ncbi:zinc-binding dehydrogenase [Acinetobacter sp. ANC 4945]|uniref:Quinone oxidoreductase n=1 Tax=Acinetobacter amyesii TaxID=2942470 RepID=A0A1T1GU73_9GAMM|nr:zinc-binding dehydrogenase [Acinetobacter amyesii]MCL6247910.1 zinc-binding dehydrogenase [Acinetobacter amyesii]OOV81128.1 quinone oxidoreductase [Acinetobacter amyesii]
MKSILSGKQGAVLGELEKPQLMPNHVLVKVKACALNRADLNMLTGATHGFVGGLGFPVGMEWAGEIVELGEGVTQWKISDRVMGAGPGAFSEYTLGNEAWIYPIPDILSYEQASTLPVALQTTHDAIVSNGNLQADQTVLVVGASSAVGLMAMQVAKFLGAKQVIGTSTSAEKLALLHEYGADNVVNTKDEDWDKQILKLTKRKGADLVIDFLAGPLFNQTMSVTKIAGTIVNVGRMAGETGTIDFDQHSMRRITYKGVSFRTRSPVEIAEVIQKAKMELISALAEGKIHLPIDSIFPFEQFNDAFDKMKANQHFGKIVLSL